LELGAWSGERGAGRTKADGKKLSTLDARLSTLSLCILSFYVANQFSRKEARKDAKKTAEIVAGGE
jgi:hypothetical protein